MSSPKEQSPAAEVDHLVENLSRSRLQARLKACRLPATGSTKALRTRYAEYRAAVVAAPPNPNPNPNPQNRLKSPPPAVAAAAIIITKEKRIKCFRTLCPQSTQQRIARAKSQRLFLVKKGEIQQNNSSCQFIILGSTGNVYTVTMERLARCTCPDHAKGNYLCKHILFVLLKVMGIESSSPLIYQAAWLQAELDEMFAQMNNRHRRLVGGGAGADGASSVLANQSVREKFAKLESGQDITEDDSCSSPSKARRQKVEEDEDCPICFDRMVVVAVAAAGAGGGNSNNNNNNTLTFCRARCGGNVHTECMQKWIQQQRPQQQPTCPMCREPWDDGTSKAGTTKGSTSSSTSNDNHSEGYANLGRLQGQSHDRDTSSYSAWSPHAKRRRRW